METQFEVLDDYLIAEENNNDDTEQLKYAGFWVRVLASIIDSIIFVPVLILYVIYIGSVTDEKHLVLDVCLTLSMAIYKPLMEYYYSATLGKMAMEIKLVSFDYQKINFTMTIKRNAPFLLCYVASLLSVVALYYMSEFQDISSSSELMEQSMAYTIFEMITSLILLISCIAVFFNKKKQGLHDQFARTYCVHR